MREALKVALEALTYLLKPMAKGWDAETQTHKRDAAITAIRAALAAPVQEPVASLLLQSKQTFEHNFGPSSAADWIYSDMAELMGTTPPAQPAPVQEPVAWIFKLNRELLWPHEVERKNPIEVNEYIPLYTTPPAAQRQWVGLTDEEIEDWRDGYLSDYQLQMIRELEAKLKEKNHG